MTPIEKALRAGAVAIDEGALTDEAYAEFKRDPFWKDHEAVITAACGAYVTALALDPETVERVADEIKGTILKDDMDCEHVLAVTPSAPRQFFERLVMKAATAALSTLTAKE